MARKNDRGGIGVRTLLLGFLALVMVFLLAQMFLSVSWLPKLSLFAQPTSTIRPGPMVIEAVQQQSRLETISMTIAGDTTIIREHGLLGACSEQIDYLAYYTISAGVDLSQITQNSIQVVNDGLPSTAAVTITLPPAEILHNELDTTNSRILAQDTTKWVPGCSHEIADMTLEAQDTLRKYTYNTALQRGILPQSEEHASEELKRILGTAGYTNVQIVFANTPPPPTMAIPTTTP